MKKFQKQQQFSCLHDFLQENLLKKLDLLKKSTVYTSPVDAKVESFGRIEWDMTFLVKGKPYALQDLLGNTERNAQYADGHFIVFI